MNPNHHYIKTSIATFQAMKSLGDKTFQQLSLEELHYAPSSESNSIAIIVKHLHGNMLSRWSDLFGSDGEKATRNRDAEFEGGYASKNDLLQTWEEGWNVLFQALQPLSDNDLTRTITIRGEKHTLLQAIHRQIAHYSNHMGQIVYLGKMIRNEDWTSLSIPRGKSLEYLREKLKEQQEK